MRRKPSMTNSAVSLTVHTFQNKNFFVDEVVRRIRKTAKSDY